MWGQGDDSHHERRVLAKGEESCCICLTNPVEVKFKPCNQYVGGERAAGHHHVTPMSPFTLLNTSTLCPVQRRVLGVLQPNEGG